MGCMKMKERFVSSLNILFFEKRELALSTLAHYLLLFLLEIQDYEICVTTFPLMVKQLFILLLLFIAF